MANKWIVDVLRDVQQVAQRQDLPRLAETLREAILVARAEIANDPISSNIDAPRRPSEPQAD